MVFDPTIPVAFDPARKRHFHREARRRLTELAQFMKLPPAGYDLVSNYGGRAISGEIILHSDRFCLQVSQSALGPQRGILIRACRGRQDYIGEINRYVPLQLLNDLPALAGQVREVLRR